MFVLALTFVLLLFIVLVAHPERWPEKCANFLREHHINNG
ncbi:MAG: hypothetical protein ACD_39C00843G0001 [uncultured bacterium]|nr:MAG: hypothetical protein ACD_39C00843G0001 [uncultured bacterium]